MSYTRWDPDQGYLGGTLLHELQCDRCGCIFFWDDIPCKPQLCDDCLRKYIKELEAENQRFWLALKRIAKRYQPDSGLDPRAEIALAALEVP